MTKRLFSSMLALLMACTLTWADGWMVSLDDYAYLSQVSIPGTHDSCTGEGWSGAMGTIFGPSMGLTQELTISQQLECGIRAFDLRPCVSGSELVINHGILQTKAKFATVIAQLCRFVADNPTEFVVVVMRHEDDGDNGNTNWGQLVSQCLQDGTIRPWLADYRRDLTVGDLRGRVLVLSRDSYGDNPVGAYLNGWGHAADYISGTIQGNGASGIYYVQDYYEVLTNMDNKLRGIKKLLDYSTRNTSTRGNRHLTLCINHTSGYTKSASTDGNRDNAAQCNRAVIDYLTEEANAGPTGIIVIDFAGTDRSGAYDVAGLQLVNTVIENNKRYEPVTAQHTDVSTPDIPAADTPTGQPLYDLSGRQAKAATHGIYINNKRKVIR